MNLMVWETGYWTRILGYCFGTDADHNFAIPLTQVHLENGR